MGVIHEETKHARLEAEVMVDQRSEGEVREPWRNIHLNIDSMAAYTPTELRELGRWLIEQGERIGRTYRSNGAPRPKPTACGRKDGNG